MPTLEARALARVARISRAVCEEAALGSVQGFVQRRSGDCLRNKGGCIVPLPWKVAVEWGCYRVPGGQHDASTFGLGGFSGAWLWSSSQNNNNNAWNQNFSNGNQNNNNKNNNNSVRACRDFERSRLRCRRATAGAGGF